MSLCLRHGAPWVVQHCASSQAVHTWGSGCYKVRGHGGAPSGGREGALGVMGHSVSGRGSWGEVRGAHRNTLSTYRYRGVSTDLYYGILLAFEMRRTGKSENVQILTKGSKPRCQVGCVLSGGVCGGRGGDSCHCPVVRWGVWRERG